MSYDGFFILLQHFYNIWVVKNLIFDSYMINFSLFSTFNFGADGELMIPKNKNASLIRSVFYL